MCRCVRVKGFATKGPMWGYPLPVLGAISPFLEPFCGHLSSKIDKVPEELTLIYPHEEPCVDRSVSLPTCWTANLSVHLKDFDDAGALQDVARALVEAGADLTAKDGLARVPRKALRGSV